MMPMMIKLPESRQCQDRLEFDGHGGSYIESVVWNQPGEASSPQYGVDGSMLCSWYIVQYSGLVARERQCAWWFGTN